MSSKKAAALALVAAYTAKRNLDLGSFSFIGERDGRVVAELNNGRVFELFTVDSIRGKNGRDGFSIAGKDGKNGRGIETITQPNDRQLDIELTDGQRLRFSLPKGEKGDSGRDGKDGIAGPRGERGPVGAAGRDGVGIQGPKGQKGDTGPAPDHEWRGTELRFRNPDGSWGKWVDLKGQPGRDGRKSVIVGSGSSSSGGGSTGGGTGGSTVGGFIPTRVKADQSFTIPEHTQAVFRKRIRLEAGARLKAYGILVQAR